MAKTIEESLLKKTPRAVKDDWVRLTGQDRLHAFLRYWCKDAPVEKWEKELSELEKEWTSAGVEAVKAKEPIPDFYPLDERSDELEDRRAALKEAAPPEEVEDEPEEVEEDEAEEVVEVDEEDDEDQDEKEVDEDDTKEVEKEVVAAKEERAPPPARKKMQKTAKIMTEPKAKKAKPAAKAAKPTGRRPVKTAKRVQANGRRTGQRPSKSDKIRALLQRKGGCTREEILKATGWPSISVQAFAKNSGLKLRTMKKKQGEPIVYLAS